MTKRVNYGIDAPTVVIRMLVIGGVFIVLGVLNRLFPPLIGAVLRQLTVSAAFLIAAALVMLWGSKVGKFRLRDKVLNQIPWLGSEQVLDVGCGHGLMLIGAAKRLTTGRAHGIDLWRDEDQASNSASATLQNAELEGVSDRVEVHTGDARQLPFPDGTFDVILSSFVIHNIPGERERARALAEIVRVLKPAGQIAIVDIRHTKRYSEVFAERGLASVHRSFPNFLFVTPTRVVTGRKPV